MKMKRGLGFALGLGVVLGSVGFVSTAHAEAMPTTCEGLENCAVVTNAEELAEFFTITDGYRTREGNSTMIIGGDFTMAADYFIKDVVLSIYLGEHTITMADYSFLFYNSTVDIYSGEAGGMTAEGVYWTPLFVRDNSNVTMYGGTITGGTASTVELDDGGKFALEDGEIYGETWVVTVFNDSEFVMNGGALTTTGPDSIGVSGNGTADPTKDNYGANAKITINGGTITSEDLGVYAPQVDGLTTIGEGATINAKKAGVEIRAGELVVNGATINVDENAEYAFNPNGSGSTASGVGIAVAQHTTKQAITATINSAVVTAPVAFAEGNPQHNPDEDIAKVSLLIKDGTFTATNGEPIVASEDVEGFVEGGVYSKVVEERYVAEGKDIFQTDEGYVVDSKINLPTDGSMAITLFKGESFDVGFELDKRGEHAWLISDDSGLYTFDGMTITAGDNIGQAKYKVNYGGLIYNQEPEEYNIEVIEVPEFEVVTDEKLGLSDEMVAAIAGKVKDILEGKVYVAEDGGISWVSEDGTIWADPGHVKEAIMNGETLRVQIWSEEILMDELDEDGLAQLNEILEDGDTVVSMHDIELLIVNAEGYEIGGVDVLDEPVVLTFTVPEEMREAPEGYTRKFYVVRHHYDRISGTQIDDRLEAEFDGENAIIQNDKFSGFVLVYQDEENVVTPETGRFTKETEDFAKSSKSYGMLVLAMGMIVLGYGLVLQGKKYKI